CASTCCPDGKQASAGADASIFSSVYSTYPYARDKYLRTAHMLRMPLYEIKRSLPVIGGGIHPATAVRIIQDLGSDIMLACGGAIQGHPDGAEAGGRAMLQAIDAAIQGTPLAVSARQHAELFKALQTWAPQELQDQ
ncbi:MAG: RuBisCO large subunit C-terminal-like domain-containing protein, partial [Anaerolineales bacterium]